MTPSQRRNAAPATAPDRVVTPAPAPPDAAAREGGRHLGRDLAMLFTSPLTLRIVALNLVVLAFLFCAMLYLHATPDGRSAEQDAALLAQADLVAGIIEVQLPARAPVSLATGDGVDVAATLQRLDLPAGVSALVFDASADLVARTDPSAAETPVGKSGDGLPEALLQRLRSLFARPPTPAEALPVEAHLPGLVRQSVETGAARQAHLTTPDGVVRAALVPILRDARPIGAVALLAAPGESAASPSGDVRRVLQTFAIATVISVALCMLLAATIAKPLAELAAAAEIGRDRNARQRRRGRVRIPDMTGRGDEIGRLSGALRGMIAALYDRIDGNEQFAADVAHEIKNPLASLRSAVGTLRVVKRDDQRERLLDVIDHDVRRLDRLVSDISNASRLDSELVKETEVAFDVLQTLTNLSQFLGEDARARGIDFFTDFPAGPITVFGLEARLAQVFVNLISNAISFCEDGDAIRVWARKRENRVLIVVEDTGPGIPEEALSKIFQRFYSHRPAESFGNNSGLGLAISKQIVEAHGGVIWAENIRPTKADITSEPLGARFVVGLPI